MLLILLHPLPDGTRSLASVIAGFALRLLLLNLYPHSTLQPHRPRVLLELTETSAQCGGPQKPAFLRIRFDSYRRCRHIGPQNANPINQPNDTRFHFICTEFFVNCISVLPRC